MPFFNESQFNTVEYNGITSYTDHVIDSTINCGSSFNILNTKVTRIVNLDVTSVSDVSGYLKRDIIFSVDITGSTTLEAGSIWISVDITGSSTTSFNITNDNVFNVIFDCNSTLISNLSGTFLLNNDILELTSVSTHGNYVDGNIDSKIGDINSLSTTGSYTDNSSIFGGIYSLSTSGSYIDEIIGYDVELGNLTSVGTHGYFTDEVLNHYIVGTSTLYPNLSINTTLSTSDITGKSEFIGDIDVFISIAADLSCSSLVTQPYLKSTYKTTANDITGSSSLVANLSNTYASAFSVDITCKSTMVLPVYIRANILGAKSNTYFTLNKISLLNLASARRIVNYKFGITKTRDSKDIVDLHFKLLQLYKSLINVDQTLLYVKRTAEKDLDDFGLDDPTNRDWSVGYTTTPNGEDGDLANITKGDKGIVQPGATGIFKGRDGQFAIYISDTVISE